MIHVFGTIHERCIIEVIKSVTRVLNIFLKNGVKNLTTKLSVSNIPRLGPELGSNKT